MDGTGSHKFYEAFKAYYKNIDDLCKRLQDEFNDGIKFESDEQDRVALCMLCDLFDAVEIGDYDNVLFDGVLSNDDSEEIEQ